MKSRYTEEQIIGVLKEAEASRTLNASSGRCGASRRNVPGAKGVARGSRGAPTQAHRILGEGVRGTGA